MDLRGLKIELDIHTHTLASGHAYGTVREMACAAGERGLKLLGMSEHAPGIPGTCDPIYFRNLEVVPKSLCGVAVFFGSEVNILNGGELSLDEQTMDGLDYRLAGIHVQCYRVGDTEENTEATVRALRHPKIDALVHPDDGTIPLDYRRVVEAAAECHKLLEVNNSALFKQARRKNTVENYKAMLSLCREKGVCVLLSSDAHDPSAVGRVDLALALLAEEAFPPELVINTSVERLHSFLGENRAKENR